MQYSETLPTLPSRKVLFGVAAFFFLLTFTVYGASLRNGFALLDDGLLIYENNAIREISLTNLKAIFTSYDPELYIPLTFLSYQFDYLIGGYNPVIYHTTNLLLHTLNVLLVTWIVFLLAGRPWVALFVGTFFAIHPLHIETVAWAAARKDLLSTFFFLLSLLLYLYYLYNLYNPSNPRRLLYILSLLFFLFGLLSKVTILTLPLILLLVEWWFRPSSPSIQAPAPVQALRRILPFFILSLLFGVIALGGKRALVMSLTFFETFLLACKSIALSLGKIFFPINLSLFYPQLTPITFTSAEFLIPTIFIVAVFLVALASFLPQYTPVPELRSVRGTASILKTVPSALLFGVAWFLITLTPSLLTFAKGGENIFVTSDRYAYLPSIGILFLVSFLFTKFLEAPTKLKVQRQRRMSSLCAASAIVLIFSALTLRQSLLWGNHVALFEHVARLSPEFYLSHIHLGVSYRLAGKLDKAEAAFKEALRLRPLGNTHGALAQVYAQQEDLGTAIVEFKKGIALDPRDYELHHGLGQVYALQHRFDEALAEFEQALALMPLPETQYLKLARRASARRDIVLERIGILYGERGMHERAVEYYEAALKENPYFADAHYNLAVALGNLGREEEAITHYEEAARLEPRHLKARVNLALLLGKRGEKLRAITLLREVLKEDPANAIAKEALRKL